MPSFKVVLAYDGTDFVGWQRQAAGVSVQGVVEDALGALDEREVAVAGAGRTDAGVHALGQVASFSIAREMKADAVLRAINARLPPTVRVVAAEEVPASFHARFDARAKTYRYHIWRSPADNPFERLYAWHLTGDLDVAAMQTAAAILVGTHDFAAFQAGGGDAMTTVRTIVAAELRIADGRLRIDWGTEASATGGSRRATDSQSAIANQSAIRHPQPAMIVFDIEGTGFLRHMVRAIVGSLVEIGSGRREPAWMAEVLASHDRTRAGPTAPAKGLFLVSVTYGVVESRFTSKES